MTLREKFPSKDKYVALVDGQLRELSYAYDEDAHVELLGMDDREGSRVYECSVLFLFFLAFRETYPDASFEVMHSFGSSLYIRPSVELDLCLLQTKMRTLVDENLNIEKIRLHYKEAIEVFLEQNMEDKAQILPYKSNEMATLYYCEAHAHYLYGYLVPSTGYINDFELMSYDDGLLLRHPNYTHPSGIPEFCDQPKLHEIHMEAEKWGQSMGISMLSELNGSFEDDRIREIIHVSEALHEAKISSIAQEILDARRRVVLIAGPSSSGKTTFARRLSIQMLSRGVRPLSISLDNYFVDREQTPLDEEGRYDFEHIQAIDVEYLSSDLQRLLNGESVFLPKFDFHRGKRNLEKKMTTLGDQQILILEGIHALNPSLLPQLAENEQWKIYVSALTQLNLDRHNRIPTSDVRLLRRIVRDARKRGYSASQTIDRWESVGRGERSWIFPYQERADAFFNSALVYELARLRSQAYSKLMEVDPQSPAFLTAKRLMKFLNYVRVLEDDPAIPSTSILREFVGGSTLDD